MGEGPVSTRESTQPFWYVQRDNCNVPMDQDRSMLPVQATRSNVNAFMAVDSSTWLEVFCDSVEGEKDSELAPRQIGMNLRT